MLLAVDIGNTKVALALFRGKRIVARWSCEIGLLSTPSRIGRFIREGFDASLKRAIEGVCISSVVPKMDSPFKRACMNYLSVDPVLVTPNNVGLKISGYDKKQIGVDRLVNSVAAYERYKGATIVIDAGSCITFDAVSSDGRYLGGAIVPGIPLASRSLNEMTAKLPLIDIQKPKRAIGRNTEESIRSGIYNGYSGLIDRLVDSISRDMDSKPVVIATGGDSKLISKISSSIEEIHPDLIFEGIHLIWQRN
ncbi:MAG: type III pantothenate kinase [Deltaproteobacteria bacterium]|nr:type III pantothenate kinase [Deltaproteobacteria bacterium]